MRFFYTQLTLAVAFVVFCLQPGLVKAETIQAIIVDAQEDRAVINRGERDGVKIGEVWVVGSPRTAAIQIEEVREHTATGKLRGEVDIGELASLGSDRDFASLVSKKRAQQLFDAPSSRDSRSLDQLKKSYKKLLSKRTERRGFVTPVGGAGGIPTGELMGLGVEAYNTYRLYDMTRSMGLDPTGMYNPWWLAASAVNVAGGQLTRNKMYEGMRVRVDVEATYWDQALVDLQTEVSAAERGLSLTQTLEEKVVRQQRKGIDKYTVFEVVLKNVGKLPAEMGEFKYRMFMMSAEGRPISASRIDPVLNETLQPGDEVRGMVYFPKIVAAGQKDLRIVFENMFGDQGDLRFKTN